ncbi:MAG: hypothetical protein MZV65_39445 [Chromatiales bacterium]|nr:hypothetical protein [Chromatiales bacterium]
MAESVGFIQISMEKYQTQTTDKLDDLQKETAEKLDQINDRLTDHVITDGNSLRRIFSSSLVQFLVVIAGVIYLIFEGKLNG